MIIYYTGAETFDAVQEDKDKSLGGFKSSSIVPNGFLNNVFGNVSFNTLDRGLSETRGFILYNEEDVDLTNVNFWFEKSIDAIGLYEVSAVQVAIDIDEVFMESIKNIRSIPYNGTFFEADGELNKQLILANMPSKSYIGIWLKRSISDTDKEQFGCDELFDRFTNDSVNPVPSVNGNIDIHIEWD